MKRLNWQRLGLQVVRDLLGSEEPEAPAPAPRSSSRLRYGTPRTVVLCRVENPARSDVKPPYITRAMLEDVVATYNPDERPAFVVAGFSRELRWAGPAHREGQYLPPLGIVRGDTWHLRFEGDELIGRVSQIIDPRTGDGRIDALVADGFVGRSVTIAPRTKETGGRAQLIYLAILGAEHPGQRGLPPLSESFGNGLERAQDEWRDFGIDPLSLGGDALGGLVCRSYPIVDGAGAPQEDDMTPEQLQALSQSIVAGVTAANESQQAAQRTLITEALAPISTSITTLVERVGQVEQSATAATTQAAEAATAARAAEDTAVAQRRSSLEQRLVALVHRGFLLPAGAEQLAQQIFRDGVPLEVAESSLAGLELAARAVRNRLTQEVRIGEETITADLSHYAENGVAPRIRQADLELVARGKAYAAKYPEAERGARFQEFVYAQDRAN